MGAWHLPAVYDAIWRSDAVYWLMQAALFLPAWAFWSAVLTGPRSAVLGHIFLTMGLAGLMGAGRTELAMSMFGRSYGRDISGRIFMHGKEIKAGDKIELDGKHFNPQQR